MSATCRVLPDYLAEEVMLHPEQRVFPPFDLKRLLRTVFEPTQGCKVAILVDFEDPSVWMKDFQFLQSEDFPIQKRAYEHFYLGLRQGVLADLGMHGGEMFAYRITHGSNLDLADDVWDVNGQKLSLDGDIYPCLLYTSPSPRDRG